MKRVTLIATALVFAVLAVLTTRVFAQDTNVHERSFITFSNTVELPGVTLPAGTYVFRLADIPTRNVVQVLSQDEKKVMGQWLFVQAQRPMPTDDTVIMFKEKAENTMPAVQYWYYPGETIGKEFVYPKDQAQKIAARTGQKVRTESGYVTPDQVDASNQSNQPQSTVASNDTGTVQGPGVNGIQSQSSSQVSSDTDRTLNNAPASAQPSAAAGSLTGNRGFENNQASLDRDRDQDRDRTNSAVGTSGSNDQNHSAVSTNGVNDQNNASANNGKRAHRLPKTASTLPLSGLIGLLSLAGAFGLRRYATLDV